MTTASRSPHHRALGHAVRELRLRQRVSQEELGYRCGLHRNYVGAVERGELNPTYGVLLRLSAGLAIPLAELIALGELRAAGDVRTDAPAPCPAGRRRGAQRHARGRLLPLWNGRVGARPALAGRVRFAQE